MKPIAETTQNQPDASRMCDFLTPLELSEELKVSRPWPYVMIKRGLLPYYKMGKTIRFKRVDIEAYLDRSRIEKKG